MIPWPSIAVIPNQRAGLPTKTPTSTEKLLKSCCAPNISLQLSTPSGEGSTEMGTGTSDTAGHRTVSLAQELGSTSLGFEARSFLLLSKHGHHLAPPQAHPGLSLWAVSAPTTTTRAASPLQGGRAHPHRRAHAWKAAVVWEASPGAGTAFVPPHFLPWRAGGAVLLIPGYTTEQPGVHGLWQQHSNTLKRPLEALDRH